MPYRVPRRRPPPGFIAPCLPSNAAKPPAGLDWIHEIKHDGFRLMAWRDGERVRLFTRNGNDWRAATGRSSPPSPRSSCAPASSTARQCACDENGLAVFRDLRRRSNDDRVFLYAFDLVVLDGEDLRREPIEARKAALAKCCARPSPACI
jgi:bifunctional non-homologous end joining protein LigD